MAHIPDGFLSPEVLAGTAAVSAGVLAVAARRSRTELEERQAPFLGAVTAFVFAAQMFNFPLGAGTSAHLLGGVLVAVLAGPWAGILALFSVLLVQALLFQDGGITALGANTLNLAVVGAGGGYLLYRWALNLLGAGPRRRMAAAGVAGFLSAVLAGVAVAGELALSGVVPLKPALVAVGGAHLLVGVAEGGLTVGILAMVVRARPELVASRDVPTTAARRWTAAASGTALVVAVGAAYLASGSPDALESAAARLGVPEGTALLPAPFAGYSAPVGGAELAAVVGVGAIFVVGWLLFRSTAGRRQGA